MIMTVCGLTSRVAWDGYFVEYVCGCMFIFDGIVSCGMIKVLLSWIFILTLIEFSFNFSSILIYL